MIFSGCVHVLDLVIFSGSVHVLDLLQSLRAALLGFVFMSLWAGDVGRKPISRLCVCMVIRFVLMQGGRLLGSAGARMQPRCMP